MMDVSRRDIDPESLLDYCRRGSDLGLAGNDEFHDLLALLHGSGPGPQEAPRSQAQTEDESQGLEPEQQQLDRAAALHGRRGPMPLQAFCHEQAAEQLLSADAMLAACPHLESAHCARVEALIQCSRWEDANSACAGLLPSVDQLYLHSELLWRQGHLPAAMKVLQDALSSNLDSRKCSERLEFLQPITESLQQASTFMEEGDMQRCEEGCSEVLQKLQGCGCSGLQALILTQRAACRLLQSDLEGALDDCCAALAAEPGSGDALHLKYQAGHPLLYPT
ncbi:g10316 [Coccomyxa viridis]|uniref:G10316 protein n=1 Tax=Coccomyxa viridis TaxID=1274662 RepID=A0ABP1G9D0_9CHLO